MNQTRPMAQLAALPIILLIFWLVAAPGVQGQLEWSRMYGGPHADGGWALGLCPDGDYVAAGYTVRGQGSDIYLLKINASGGTVWSLVMGGSEDDSATALQTVSDGIVLAGSTKSYSVGGERLWVAKVDYGGNLLWEHSYGGFVTSSGDGAWSIREIDDGYIVAGYTRSDSVGGKDLWLLRLDFRGVPVWSRSFGGGGDEAGFSVLPVDPGIVAAGYTRSLDSDHEDIYAVMTDGGGSILWNRTFAGQEDAVAFSMLRVEDGLVLAGRTDQGGDKDVLLMKISERGDEVWSRHLGGPGNQSALALTSADDGGLLLVGWTETSSSSRDLLLIKTDGSGLLQWSRIFGGPGPDMGTSILRNGKRCLVLGVSSHQGSEDLWLLNLSLDGIRPDEGGAVDSGRLGGEAISVARSESAGGQNAREGEYPKAGAGQQRDWEKLAPSGTPPWRSSQEIAIPEQADNIKKFFKA